MPELKESQSLRLYPSTRRKLLKIAKKQDKRVQTILEEMIEEGIKKINP